MASRSMKPKSVRELMECLGRARRECTRPGLFGAVERSCWAAAPSSSLSYGSRLAAACSNRMLRGFIPTSRLTCPGRMHMGQLPSIMLPDEQERAPLQRQLAPTYGKLQRKRDQSHIPVALHPDLPRLQVQVGRPRSARPRFFEEAPPARFDPYLTSNSVRRVAKRKEYRRL